MYAPLLVPARDAALPAPPWQVQRWFNTKTELTLASLRGKVVVLHAFQMLCRGCAEAGTPQAQRVHEQFTDGGVVVVGLHTVFEHHEAMTPVSLEAFLHEYRLTFPVAVDMPDGRNGVPRTMRAYGMQGTPSLTLIDHQGRRRLDAFGHVPDLYLGAAIATLQAENELSAPAFPDAGAPMCSKDGCS